MPGVAYRIALAQATESLSKRKGKGSDDVYAALKPSVVLKVKGNEKLGKKK